MCAQRPNESRPIIDVCVKDTGCRYVLSGWPQSRLDTRGAGAGLSSHISLAHFVDGQSFQVGDVGV